MNLEKDYLPDEMASTLPGRNCELEFISDNDSEQEENSHGEAVQSSSAQDLGEKQVQNQGRKTSQWKSTVSGVRLLMKHVTNKENKVHPKDGGISPQLIVKDGGFEIFDPNKIMLRQQTTLSKHVKIKHGTQNSTSKSCGIFSSLKWKMEMFKFKYGDLVPFFRKQIKKVEGRYGTGVASVFRFTRWAIMLNLILSIIWIGFLVVPAAIEFDYKKLDQFDFKFENIIDGKGKLQHTWMFYGSYTANVDGYRTDFAYIVLGLLTFFGSLLIILKSTVNTDTSVSDSEFTMLLLASWDFSITAKEAKQNLTKGIVTLAKDMLSEAQAVLKTRSRSRVTKCSVYARRLCAWIITSALTGGACVTIYLFMTKITVAEFIIKNTNVQIGKNFLETYGFSLLFSLLNAVLPFIIERLPMIEAYEKGSHVLYVNVIRVFLLRFLNIIALLVTLYNTVTSSKFRGCGGTFIGQEFYKIILLDTAVVTVIQLSIKFIWYAIRRKKAEPAVSKIVLQIVYRQALIWAGTFFCPVIPLLGLLSQSMVFLVNYVIILATCRAPVKRFRKAEGIVFFKSCLIATLVCLLVPISTVFTSRYISVGTLTTTSSNGTVVQYSCGPFGDRPPIDVFEEGKASLPGWLSKIANWFTSAAVFPAILVLSIIIYIQHLRLKNARKRLKQLEKDHLDFQKRSNIRMLTNISEL